MSYDLQIWSVRPFDAAVLGQHTNSSRDKDFVLPGKNWQIVINRSDHVVADDVEDAIASRIPGIRYLTELNLEGKAPDKAHQLLHATARKIARNIHGVVVDPQSDRISTPTGVDRFVAPKKEKTFSVITLSWWFLNDQMFHTKGRRSFLKLLEKHLPEALPKRYGEYEPPQFQFNKTGLDHLERFIGKHLEDEMVWYPSRPVANVTLKCPKPLGPHHNGFRTNLVEVQLETSALAQPGWSDQLQLFWRQMTLLLQPIYGEVRTEAGYSREKSGAVFVDATTITNHYPFTNRSWFWRGVPQKLGHAVVLGKEYQKLWPQFAQQAVMEGGFAFASMPEWSGNADLLQLVGPPPIEITLLPGEGLGPKQVYPAKWPFDPPFGS